MAHAVRRRRPACSSPRPTSGSRRSASTTPLGVDGLGLLLVLLTVLLVPVVIVASWHDADRRQHQGVLRLGARPRGARRSASSPRPTCSSSTCVFEATLIPAYFLIGGFGREGRRGRAEVPDVPARRRPGAARRGDRALRRLRQRRPPVVPADRPVSSSTSTRTRRALAVRRLLHRVRGQGAAVPGAHLAGRHDREGHARHERAAGLRPRQDRHLRDAAVLPRAVPRGLAAGRRRSWSRWR